MSAAFGRDLRAALAGTVVPLRASTARGEDVTGAQAIAELAEIDALLDRLGVPGEPGDRASDRLGAWLAPRPT